MDDSHLEKTLALMGEMQSANVTNFRLLAACWLITTIFGASTLFTGVAARSMVVEAQMESYAVLQDFEESRCNALDHITIQVTPNMIEAHGEL